LVLALIKRTDNPISWWKKHHSKFPNLKNLVLKYLSAPPSSVNSERLFSSAGNVYVDNRNKLLPDNAKMLIFIIKNLKI